jgi:hypothetical protein
MKTADLVRLTKRSRQTLNNYKHNYPALFEIVQLGCEAKQNQDKCKTLLKTPAT